MTDTIHLSFGKEYKKFLELHQKAVEEGRKRGKTGLTTEIYCKALADYFGISSISAEEAKKELSRIEEQENLSKLRKEALINIISEYDTKQNQDTLAKEKAEIQQKEQQSKQIEADYQKKIQTNLKYLLERFNISKEDAEVEAESYVIYKGTPQGQADKKGFNEYFEARGYELKAKKKPVIINAISKEVHHNDL